MSTQVDTILEAVPSSHVIDILYLPLDNMYITLVLYIVQY